MSRIAPNFGRSVNAEPENAAGLRRGGVALTLLSVGMCPLYLPAGIVGMVAGVLWMAASKPVAVATRSMDASIDAGDRAGGCGWYVATMLVGLVVFALVLLMAGAAMAGR